MLEVILISNKSQEQNPKNLTNLHTNTSFQAKDSHSA